MSKLYTIEEIKELAIPIAKEHGVPKLALFGSFARGDATVDSDIDFLIDRGTSEKMRGWNFFGFALALEEVFEKKVDVLTYKCIDDSYIKKYALKEEIVLYEL